MGQSFRIGMRVEDVAEAVAFFDGLGFAEEGVVPDPDGRPLLAILRRGEATLVLDALVGLPFPETPREQQVKSGPRGLGVVFGLEVEDLEAAYHYCLEAGCEITCEPMDEAWGERLFTCLDPFGYEWELFQPIVGMEPTDGIAAAYTSWFGETPDESAGQGSSVAPHALAEVLDFSWTNQDYRFAGPVPDGGEGGRRPCRISSLHRLRPN